MGRCVVTYVGSCADNSAAVYCKVYKWLGVRHFRSVIVDAAAGEQNHVIAACRHAVHLFQLEGNSFSGGALFIIAYFFSVKIESDLYVNGSREAAGEIFYEPGKNTVNSKVKFFMDLGLIDHYYLGYSVTAYLDDDDNIVSISVDENRNNVGVHMAKAAEAFLTGYNGFAGGCTNCKFEV